MPDPEEIELWLDSLAQIGHDIEGIKSSFAGGNGNQPDVQPMISEELLQSPAAVWGYGGTDILAGQWEVQTHTVDLGIWIEAADIGMAYREAVAYVDRVLAKFPPHAKAGNVSERVQSAVITTIGRPTPRAWPEGSERKYIVLPVTFQVRVARAAQYQPN